MFFFFFLQFGVEDLDQPAQNQDLNPINTFRMNPEQEQVRTLWFWNDLFL